MVHKVLYCSFKESKIFNQRPSHLLLKQDTSNIYTSIKNRTIILIANKIQRYKNISHIKQSFVKKI